jgi:hypothetical protein
MQQHDVLLAVFKRLVPQCNVRHTTCCHIPAVCMSRHTYCRSAVCALSGLWIANALLK